MVRNRYRCGVSQGLLVAGIFLALGCVGCSTDRTPMEVDITQLAPYSHAANAPDCQMPILPSLPLTTYRQVAIVEAWADLKDVDSDVMPALKRKACETGADALVIINSKHQDVKNLLYQATPNESLDETTKQNVYAGQGEYINQMEHTRRIGEAGHNGLYIDAVAIDYSTPENKSTTDSTPAQVEKPKG